MASSRACEKQPVPLDDGRDLAKDLRQARPRDDAVLRHHAARDAANGRDRLALLSDRLEAAPPRRLAQLADRLDGLDRMRLTLGYQETLKRGYAVVRGADDTVITDAALAATTARFAVQFRDGSVWVQPEDDVPTADPTPKPAKSAARARPKGEDPAGGQGSLF